MTPYQDLVFQAEFQVTKHFILPTFELMFKMQPSSNTDVLKYKSKRKIKLGTWVVEFSREGYKNFKLAYFLLMINMFTGRKLLHFVIRHSKGQ